MLHMGRIAAAFVFSPKIIETIKEKIPKGCNVFSFCVYI